MHAIPFVLVLAWIFLDNLCLCQYNISSDSSIALQTTYRSVVEKAIQGVGGIAGKITGFFLPNVVTSTGITSVENEESWNFGAFMTKFTIKVRAIFPGTRWCGDGNKANSEEDVGLFYKTDACCRAHDKCPFIIGAGQILGPLINDGMFTRSSCQCDQEFYQCLKNVNSLVAYKIGHTYFTLLGPQCITYNYPITSCKQRGGKQIIRRKCIEYEIDMTRNMTIQWIDNPDF